MAGAANIKRWVEGVLPEFAEELGSIESSAHMAAANSTVELHALCDRFDTVLKESFGQVQPVVEGQGVRRQPIWFDHELALGRRAAHAAMRRSPRSAIALRLQKEYQTMLRRKQRVVSSRKSSCSPLRREITQKPSGISSRHKSL